MDEMLAVINGIPQGSPISPILAIFYASELNEILDRHEHVPATQQDVQHKVTRMTLRSIVDDGKLIISSKMLAYNVAKLSAAYLVVITWLKAVGLSADIETRELAHYHHRHQNKIDNSSIWLPGNDTEGPRTEIKPSATVRWLGAYFDRKLTFHQHVKNMAGKAMKVINATSMLANTVRGLSQTHMRTLYITCVLPVATYASPAWWTGKEWQVKTLEKVQNQALRSICAVFRTTPCNALRSAAGLMPAHQRLNLINENAAIRFHKLDYRHPLRQRLPDSWRQGEDIFDRPPLPPHRSRPRSIIPPPLT